MPLKPRLVWKTLLLYIGLLYGMLGSSISVARGADAVTTNIEIQNPIGPNNQTIIQLIAAVTAKLTPFVITLATFSILVVGFQFVVAGVRGDSTGLKSARTNLMWVLIGTAIVVGAAVIAAAVKTFLRDLH